MENRPPRRRGAQPGNTNALKKGFYSLRFCNGELADLEETTPDSLRDEIAMLRVVIRRVVSLAEEGKPPAELLSILDKLGTASLRVANLLKTQKLLGNGSEPSVVIHQALSEVIKEMGHGS